MTNIDKLITARKARLKPRDSVFESERLKAWHTRQNVVHRFGNGALVEIKLTEREKP